MQAVKSEMQPTSEGSDRASRPSLKRKHEETSSVQPQYQVLHYQTPDSQYVSVKEEQEDTSDDTVKEPGIKQEKETVPSELLLLSEPVLEDTQLSGHQCESQDTLKDTRIKQEKETVPSELLLLTEPMPDCSLMSEDTQPETSTDPTVNSVFVPKPNDYIQVINIQDILKRKARPKNSKILNPVSQTNWSSYSRIPSETLKNSYLDYRCKSATPMPITISNVGLGNEMGAPVPKTNANVDCNSKIGNPIPHTNSNLDSSNKIGNHIPKIIHNLLSTSKIGTPSPQTKSNMDSTIKIENHIPKTKYYLESTSKIENHIPKTKYNLESTSKIGNPVPKTNPNFESASKIGNPVPKTNPNFESASKIEIPIPKTKPNLESINKIGNPTSRTNSHLIPVNKIGHPSLQTNSNFGSTSDIGKSIPTTNSRMVSASILNLNDKMVHSNGETLKNSFFVQCQECKQFLPDMSSAKLHKCPVSSVPIFVLPVSALSRDEHGNIKASECKVCKALFISDVALNSHVKSDHLEAQKMVPQSNLILQQSNSISNSQKIVPKSNLLLQQSNTISNAQKMVSLSNLILQQSNVVSNAQKMVPQSNLILQKSNTVSNTQKIVPQSNPFPQKSSVVLPTSGAQNMVPKSNSFVRKSNVISNAQKTVSQSNHFPQISSLDLPTFGAQKMVPQSNNFSQQSSVILPSSGAQKIVPSSNPFPQKSSVILPTLIPLKMVSQSNNCPQQSNVVLPTSGAQKMVPQSNLVSSVFLPSSRAQKMVPQSNHFPQKSSVVFPTFIAQKMVPQSNIVPQSVFGQPSMVSPSISQKKIVPQSNLVSQVEEPEIVLLESEFDQETKSNLIPESVTGKTVLEKSEHRISSVVIWPQSVATKSREECNFVGIVSKIPESQEKFSVETRLRNFVPFEVDPESFPTLVEFYRHFCKFHLKRDYTETTSATVTIPHLVQCVKPMTTVLGLYLCQQCGMRFKNIDEYKVHLFKVHKISKPEVECKICHVRIEFQVNLIVDHLQHHKNHYNHLISEEQMCICLKCEELSDKCITLSNLDYKFHFKNLIVTRKLVPHNAKLPPLVYFKYNIDKSLPEIPHKRYLYSCICCETFDTQFELDHHLESHIDCAFRKCSSCAVHCDNMKLYYEHVEKMHASSLLPDVDFRNKKEQLFLKNNDHFACSNINCCEELINSCSLQLHARRSHTSKMRIISAPLNVEKLQCKICEVEFFDPKLFYSHCVPYSPLLPSLLRECPKCVLCFNSDSESKAHLDEIHNGVDSFWCRICSVPQYSAEKLHSHVRKDHNVSMFYCILCKTNFVNKKIALFIHLKKCYSVDTSVKDFICPICGLICDDFDFLITHARLDFELSKPKHQCKFCLNFFYGKLNLACHMLDAKCCVHCGLYFCNARNLVKHVGNVHAR